MMLSKFKRKYREEPTPEGVGILLTVIVLLAVVTGGFGLLLSNSTSFFELVCQLACIKGN